jgi:hypothetical protein
MKNLKMFIALIVLGIVGGAWSKSAHIPSWLSGIMVTFAAFGVLYYLTIFPVRWLYRRFVPKSKAAQSPPLPCPNAVGANATQSQGKVESSVGSGAARGKNDAKMESPPSLKGKDKNPLGEKGMPESQPLGKSYNRVHNIRFVKWEDGEGEGDFIDRIDQKYNVTVLENSDTGECLAYSNLTEKLHAGESFNEAIGACFEQADRAIKSLYAGLAISAKDEDEDGMYEYLKEHGGEMEFGRETDIPTELNDSGFACVYARSQEDEIIVCSTGADPKIKINGGKVVSIAECHGYLDDDENRVAFFTKAKATDEEAMREEIGKEKAEQRTKEISPDLGEPYIAPLLSLALVPIAKSIIHVEIRDVDIQGPDEEDNLSIIIKYAVTNSTLNDWDYLEFRSQIITASGMIAEETTDTKEQIIEPGQTAEFSSGFNAIQQNLLGPVPGRSQVIVSATACRLAYQKLGVFALPDAAYDVKSIGTASVEQALELLSGSLWKDETNDGNTVSIQARAWIQNITDQYLPKVELVAAITDRLGRKLADDMSNEVRIPPGAAVMIEGSSSGPEKQMKGAQVDLFLRVYQTVAAGFAQQMGVVR